jgi:hypothetical protein
MNRSLRVVPALAAGLALVLLGGCTGTLTQIVVPPAVLAGSTFEIVLIGTSANGSTGEALGAVVQLPPGFAVVGVASSNRDTIGNVIPITTNLPALLGMYTPETGSTLVSFSAVAGTGVSNPVVLRVRLAAPAVAGTSVIKVAVAGMVGTGWQAQDPVGVTSFASITGTPYTAAVTVHGVPVPSLVSWIEDVQGLPNYDPGNWTGAAFGDVNGDGRQDLACIARLGPPARVLLRGPSTGWTNASAGLTGTPGRSDVAFGDFNGDHLLDLADGNGRCFLGNGGSLWTNASTGLFGFVSEGVAVGDVNGDGLDDVAFAGHTSPVLRCHLSQGDGTWVDSSVGLPTTQPAGTAVAGGHKLLMRDVNGDGFQDIVWTRIQAAGIWLGNGAGGWTELAGSGLEPQFQFFGVDAGDVDQDGDVDLVFGAMNVPATPNSPLGIRLYRQQPGPTFVYDGASGLPATGAYLDVALADFDRDGLLDVVAGRSFGVDGGVEIWAGLPGGTFAAAPWVNGLPARGIPPPEGIAVGDVNDDTFPDIALSSYGLGVFVFKSELSGVSLFGTGCQGASAYQPVMSTTGGPPNIGNAGFGIVVSGARPNAGAYLVAGPSRTFFSGQPILPIDLAPFGAPGCFLLTEPVLSFPVNTGPMGSTTFFVPIPNDPSIVHFLAFAQWVVFDAIANPLGVATSQGAAVRIGQ